MAATFTGLGGLFLSTAGNTLLNGRERYACEGNAYWTMGCWARFDDDQVGQTADFLGESFTNTNTGTWIGMRIDDGVLIARTFGTTAVGNQTLTSSKAVRDGNWHLCVLVRDGDSLRLYVDNPYNSSAVDTPAASATGLGTTADSASFACVNIGRSPAQKTFDGAVAYAFGAEYAMTAWEILRIFNMGVPSFQMLLNTERGLNYLWKCNDTTGTVRSKFGLAADAGAGVTFADNRTLWPACGEPPVYALADLLRFDPAAVWRFQEAPNGADSVFVDDVAGLRLVPGPNQTGIRVPASLVQFGDGLFGPHSLRLTTGLETEANVTGRMGNILSVVAWVKTWFEWTQNDTMGVVAGVWDESKPGDPDTEARRLAIFHSLRDAPVAGLAAPATELSPSPTVNCHISVDGSKTPGYNFNYDVAYDGACFRHGYDWVCMTAVYRDGLAWAYTDGVRTPGLRNPYDPLDYHASFPGLYAAEAPFRVGANYLANAGTWGNYAECDIAGVAVFDRALTDAEVAAIARVGDPSSQATGGSNRTEGRTISRI